MFLNFIFQRKHDMIFEFQNPIDINHFVEFMEFDLHRAKVKF